MRIAKVKGIVVSQDGKSAHIIGTYNNEIKMQQMPTQSTWKYLGIKEW